MDPQLKKLIDSHKPYFTVQADGKIKCEINGHCFPPKYEAVAAFVK